MTAEEAEDAAGKRRGIQRAGRGPVYVYLRVLCVLRDELLAVPVARARPMARRRVSSRMLFTFSRPNTRSTTFLAFGFDSLPHAAHSPNFSASSSSLIGFTGLPLPKSARPLMVRPST